MTSERTTQFLNYLRTLYHVLLQIVLGTLYCGKYLCIGLSSTFAGLTEFFGGAIGALDQEIAKVKDSKTHGGTA